MYYRIKVSEIENCKTTINTYITTGDNFAEAVQKVIRLIGTDYEVEEIKLMKNFKPAINEKYADTNKLYMIKIAEDMLVNGKTKTVKYELPVFANDSNELHKIVNDYMLQGFDDMRLTTISETKWIWVE